MRAWNDLGVVETIYEEEHEDASNSPSFTPSTASPSSSSPSSSSLQSKVEEWYALYNLALPSPARRILYARRPIF